MSEPNAPGGPRAAARELLRRPGQLRLVLGLLLLGAWYGGVYLPLRWGIDAAAARLVAERQRLDLARQVAHLRRETGRYRGHRPEGSDAHEWVRFLMDGIRQYPLKLVNLEPRPAADVGPYRAAVLQVAVEGTYGDLERFLRWLEGAPRLIRVEAIRITTRKIAGPAGGKSVRTGAMALTVMGVTG